MEWLHLRDLPADGTASGGLRTLHRQAQRIHGEAGSAPHVRRLHLRHIAILRERDVAEQLLGVAKVLPAELLQRWAAVSGRRLPCNRTAHAARAACLALQVMCRREDAMDDCQWQGVRNLPLDALCREGGLLHDYSVHVQRLLLEDVRRPREGLRKLLHLSPSAVCPHGYYLRGSRAGLGWVGGCQSDEALSRPRASPRGTARERREPPRRRGLGHGMLSSKAEKLAKICSVGDQGLRATVHGV